MKYAAVFALAAYTLFGQSPEKPKCTRNNRGQLWPEAANSDRMLSQQLFRSGELEMCSPAGWKYKWQHVSLNIQQKLARAAEDKREEQPSSPAALPDGH